jgi:hypothetical protein
MALLGTKPWVGAYQCSAVVSRFTGSPGLQYLLGVFFRGSLSLRVQGKVLRFL